MSSRLQSFYGRAFAIALAFMPLICVLAPRFAGLGPPLLAFAGLAFYYAAYRRLPKFSLQIFCWSLAFPLLMGLSSLWSINPAESLDRTIRTIPVVLSGAVLFSLGRELDEKSTAHFRLFLPWAVILSGFVIAAELYASAPLFHFLHNLSHPEKKFNLSHLNRSVVVFTLSSFMAFYCLQSGDLPQRHKNFMLILLCAVTALVLAATSSQSTQLAFVLGAVFYFGFPVRQKILWQALAVLLGLLMLTTPWLAHFLFQHFAGPAADIHWLKSSYIPYRMEIWDFVSRRALQRPFLGFGVEATREITDFDTTGIYDTKTEVLHPHNFAVQIWIEFGLLGALLTAAFFARILNAIHKLDTPEARMLLAVFVACLSVATTGYGIWQSWWLGMFCLLLGFTAAIFSLKQRA